MPSEKRPVKNCLRCSIFSSTLPQKVPITSRLVVTCLSLCPLPVPLLLPLSAHNVLYYVLAPFLAKPFFATALTLSRYGDISTSSRGSRPLVEDRRPRREPERRCFSSQDMGPQALGISPRFADASELPLFRQSRMDHTFSTHISRCSV